MATKVKTPGTKPSEAVLKALPKGDVKAWGDALEAHGYKHAEEGWEPTTGLQNTAGFVTPSVHGLKHWFENGRPSKSPKAKASGSGSKAAKFTVASFDYSTLSDDDLGLLIEKAETETNRRNVADEVDAERKRLEAEMAKALAKFEEERLEALAAAEA